VFFLQITRSSFVVGHSYRTATEIQRKGASDASTIYRVHFNFQI